MKTIIISFANSSTAPLRSIAQEEEEVQLILTENVRGSYEVFPVPFATVANMNKALEMFSDHISIFHYSGHAGQESLLFSDQEANGIGIAYQLKPSINSGALKLVILNGCSTAPQVNKLLELGVPAVIATNASVDDTAARIFSTTFFRNIAQRRMTIRNAFSAALAAAQLATKASLGLDEAVNRDLHVPGSAPREPFWGLFYKNASAVDGNPLPVEATAIPMQYEPNLQLAQAIFTALVKDGNIAACQLDEKKLAEVVDDNKFQQTILEVLPHPIAIQLKTLFAAELTDEAVKQPGIRRLAQIGRVFHITAEFMGIIMISQLWELKITQRVKTFPKDIADRLTTYFNLDIDGRATYDYSSLIKDIRKYIDTLPDVNYFVAELKTLREEDAENARFHEACDYLSYIRNATYTSKVRADKPAVLADSEIPQLCFTAENMLSIFFEKLGFLHRYLLTSVQNIRINKFRHDLQAEFDHQVVRLMNPNASHEVNYYVLKQFLDNSGVVLTKQVLTVLNVERRQYKYDGDVLDFLNLSPLVIDVNAFESGSDRSNLVVYGQYIPERDVYIFRNVSKPDAELDQEEININRKFGRTERQEQSRYEAVCKQLTAFRAFALQEATV